MDQTLDAFREVAERENQHRRLRRRYSPELRQQALTYWEQRRSHEGVRIIVKCTGFIGERVTGDEDGSARPANELLLPPGCRKP